MKQLAIVFLISSLSIMGVSGCTSTQAAVADAGESSSRVFCAPGQTGKGRC